MKPHLSLLVLAATFATPALQAEDCLERAWSGTLGKSRISLEFRTINGLEDGQALKGRYYYGANWNELVLERAAGDGGEWLEKDDKDAVTGHLTLECGAGSLGGRWRSPDGSRSLELKATPAASYNVQRRQGVRSQLLQAGRFKGRAYEEISGERGTELKTFRLKGEQPGIAAVNELLWQRHLDTLETAADCLSDGRLRSGQDHDNEYSLSSEIVEWNDAFLVVTSNEGGYCGGAHPFWGYGGQTFNLAEGKIEKMEKWLTAEYAADIATDSALDQRLRKIYADGAAPDEHMRECLEAITFTPGALWPRSGGLAFTPHAPHALSACAGEDVILPYTQATPFLSDYGQAQVKAFLNP